MSALGCSRKVPTFCKRSLFPWREPGSREQTAAERLDLLSALVSSPDSYQIFEPSL
jgi:hypothetical protein